MVIAIVYRFLSRINVFLVLFLLIISCESVDDRSSCHQMRLWSLSTRCGTSWPRPLSVLLSTQPRLLAAQCIDIIIIHSTLLRLSRQIFTG